MSYKDYNNIHLNVETNSGILTGPLTCSIFRIYSQPYSSCDAHATIICDEINGLKNNHKRIPPKEYVNFIDNQGKKWKIVNFTENNPPEAPAFYFCLTR